eukprot:Hpha_TRINITY_DN8599_c0_g1::TRINITY_DN8599_c0_g1_i2::g.146417::m.146417
MSPPGQNRRPSAGKEKEKAKSKASTDQRARSVQMTQLQSELKCVHQQVLQAQKDMALLTEQKQSHEETEQELLLRFIHAQAEFAVEELRGRRLKAELRLRKLEREEAEKMARVAGEGVGYAETLLREEQGRYCDADRQLRDAEAELGAANCELAVAERSLQEGLAEADAATFALRHQIAFSGPEPAPPLLIAPLPPAPDMLAATVPATSSIPLQSAAPAATPPLESGESHTESRAEAGDEASGLQSPPTPEKAPAKDEAEDSPTPTAPAHP